MAVCDVDAQKMKAAQGIVDDNYGQQGGKTAGYRDFRDLLARKDIDAGRRKRPLGETGGRSSPGLRLTVV